MTMGAFLGIAGMVIGAGAIIRSVMIFRQSISSVDPDPERVRRFIEDAPPLPQRFPGNDSKNVRSAVQAPSVTEAGPGAHGHDHEADSR
ncbi:MAG: hypothetical protein AB7S99_12375 [Pseudodonghicola sp.]